MLSLVSLSLCGLIVTSLCVGIPLLTPAVPSLDVRQTVTIHSCGSFEAKCLLCNVSTNSPLSYSVTFSHQYDQLERKPEEEEAHIAILICVKFRVVAGLLKACASRCALFQMTLVGRSLGLS